MKCEYCGSNIVDKGNCPNCGAPAPKSRQDEFFDKMEDIMDASFEQVKKSKNEANFENKIPTPEPKTDDGYHPNTDFNQNAYSPDTSFNLNGRKKNTFGIIALVFSATYFLGVVGLIMAIYDLIKKKSRNRIYSVIAIIVFALLLAITGLAGLTEVGGVDSEAFIENDMRQGDDLDVSAIASTDEVIEVTFDEMMYDLDTDYDTAFEKYYGKNVELTGEFNGVKSYDEYCFEICEIGDVKDVECTFTFDQAEEIDKLSKHKDVVIRGVITKVNSIYGYEMVFTDIIATAEELSEERSEPIVDENAIPETREEVLTRRFKEIVDIECDDLAVTWDADSNCYQISYYPTEYYADETRFVELNFTYYINFCREMYRLEDMDTIDFEVYSMMIDSKGNEEIENVISFRMNKDEFETYDWENLKNNPIYYQFIESCDYAWIHDGILSDLDREKVRYMP